MADPATIEWTPAEHAYIEAMRAEVLWAPIHFDGWSHYERARPVMPGEAIEVIGRWPEYGQTLQYRPLLEELSQARQTPVDRFPEITVLGQIDEKQLSQLRDLSDQGRAIELAELAGQMAKADRTIAAAPPVRTGSIIPEHSEIEVHYVTSGGEWLKDARLIHEDHPSAAYAVAGHWGIRLGRPVGRTPTGLLVFQPMSLEGARLTIEYPIRRPVGPQLTESRVGVYRYDGLGGWHQTATLHHPDELHMAIGARFPDVVRSLSVADIKSLR